MVKYVLRHHWVSTRQDDFRTEARARRAVHAARGKNKSSIRDNVKVTKIFFRPIRLKLHHNVGLIISYRVVKFQPD